MSEQKKDEQEPVAVATMNVKVEAGEDGQPKVSVQPPELRFLGVRLVYSEESKSFVGKSFRGAKIEVTVGNGPLPILATVSGEGFGYASSDQPTVPMAEEHLKSQLLALADLVSFLNVEMVAPASVTRMVERFIVGWGALPPLVRAGYANGLVDHFYSQISNRRRHEEKLRRFTSLSRRMRVDALFQRASMVFFDLAVGLTGEADAEAEARGIDEDIRYRGSPLLDPSPIADVAEAVERENIAGMTEEIAKEIDHEVVAETDRALGVKKKSEFGDELRTLLNKHSMENGSDTPDFALARFMVDSLDAYEAAVVVREKHAGRR